MSTAKKITGWMKDAGMLATDATLLGGKKLWQGVKDGATYAYEHRALAKEAAWGIRCQMLPRGEIVHRVFDNDFTISRIKTLNGFCSTNIRIFQNRTSGC